MKPKRHAHLVGSINLPSAAETLDMAANTLSHMLLRIPDGEPGPRRGWVFYQLPMFTHNTQLTQPDDPNQIMSFQPRTVKPGVSASDLNFPELGYAREARLSFQDFTAAKRAGKIPEHVRFQVSLPTPLACISVAVAPEAAATVEPAYEAAMLREVASICAAIPHDELAIQWDLAIEMLLFDGRAYGLPWDDEGHRRRFARLTASVPSTVHHGVHLCYGDLEGKHAVEPVDATKMVELANLITETTARPLQWIHMPVPIARDDDAYFAPMADLKIHPETELFLGLVHHADGAEGARRRIKAAERFIQDFGVGTECGIGRAHSPSDVLEIFKIHAALG